jgi:hypothetical protein
MPAVLGKLPGSTAPGVPGFTATMGEYDGGVTRVSPAIRNQGHAICSNKVSKRLFHIRSISVSYSVCLINAVKPYSFVTTMAKPVPVIVHL